MKFRLIVIALALTLSACNVAVTSLPAQPPLENTEPPPTPYPDTPAPEAINASPVGSPALIEIHFLNELDGWGVTELQIVRTNDGGITWYNVTPPDATEIAGVAMFVLDATHVWMLKPDFNNFPNNGLLYRTIDGGLTWTISSTPFSGGDLTFIDVNNGWMLADLGVGAGSNAVAVFQTVDGGTTWMQTYTNDPGSPDAGDSLPLGGLKADLVPLNMQTAWVAGVTYAPGVVYLYRTDDGGHNWSLLNLEVPAGVENSELSIDRDQMQFVSASAGFLAVRLTGDTTRTAVYTTSDGGTTWTLTPTLIPGAGSFDFLSAREAIMYNGEQFYVTRDAAQTWTTISPNLAFGDSFAAMDFVNSNTGWVVTLDGSQHRSLYRTLDGGATWLPVIP
ncbi:MAG: WD40/YVTN/BNR-like repeat-containing protein [Chloroflexota bacterium]